MMLALVADVSGGGGGGLRWGLGLGVAAHFSGCKKANKDLAELQKDGGKMTSFSQQISKRLQ